MTTARVLCLTLAFAFSCGDDAPSTGGGSQGGTSAEGGTSAGGAPAGGASTGGIAEGGAGGAPDKAALCDDTFGEALTASFGRIDGTVLAVVRPQDTQCTLFNDDHVVIEVTMNGATYRVVVNILSAFDDPDVRFLELDHELPGPPWQEGWHTGVTLDYASDFDAHNGPPFEPIPMDELAQRITDDITIGQKISVYSDSDGGSSSHKVHRNDGTTDGAIILDPEGDAPKALLFHFSDQQF